MRTILAFILAFFILCASLSSQEVDSLPDYKLRKKILWVGTSALYSSTLYSLDRLWYQGYPRSSFQYFNDNKQWLGVDKVGHTYSAYVAATTGIKAFEWAGYNRTQAALIGGSVGWIFLGTVEVFDGFSAEWGFSKGDILANTVGASLAIGQYLIWDKQIMRLKFSYSPTEYRELNSDLLGENELHAIFKDYNGQTYWASFNLHSIDQRIKPEWLNLAFGYGGKGMVNASEDFTSELGERFQHRREYYLSLDIDFEKIKTNKAWVKTILTCLNYFKLPFPALSIEEGKGLVIDPMHF